MHRGNVVVQSRYNNVLELHWQTDTENAYTLSTPIHHAADLGVTFSMAIDIMKDTKMNNEIIIKENDILNMLDAILKPRNDKWWDNFYIKNDKQIPFLCDSPDENLIDYINNKKIPAGNALEIGCGNGRNAFYLAKNKFNVEAIDFSHKAIEIAENKYKSINNLNFEAKSIFDYHIESEKYNFIYECGCMHHINPHRRYEYFTKIHLGLKNNGYYGLVCFNEKGGANISDYDVYREKSMKGGLAFTEEKLYKILTPLFKIIELRTMKNITDNSAFGLDSLWTVLVQKN